jgi:hypothetical protein
VAGRAGVFAHPTAKGSRPGGWKEPFAPLSSSEHYCRSSREAPTGLRDAPSRPRVSGAPGERAMAPPRSTRRATSCSVLFEFARPEGGPSLFVSALKRPDDSSDVRLCSDGGHPGGQGSGERRKVPISLDGERCRDGTGVPKTTAKWAAFGRSRAHAPSVTCSASAARRARSSRRRRGAGRCRRRRRGSRRPATGAAPSLKGPAGRTALGRSSARTTGCCL